MWLAQAVWLLATVGAIVASATMNYHYMAGEGADTQGQILGAVSVVLDLGKAVLPVLIAGAWAAHAWWRASLGGAFLVLLILFGFASALGFGEASKGGRVATREGASAMLSSVDAEIAALEAKRRGLQSHRSLPEVEAALRSAWLAPVVDGPRIRGTVAAVSKQCTVLSAAVIEPCRALQVLMVEVATSGEGTRIEARLAELRLEQWRLRALGAGQDADPQATVIRRLVGRLLPDPDLATVRAMVVGVLAVLIEGMSAFGLYLAGIHHRAIENTGRAAIVLPTCEGKDRLPSVNDGEVTCKDAVLIDQASQPALPAPEVQTMTAARWAVERLDFVAGGSVLLADAIADYRASALAAGVAPLADREFRQALIGTVLDLELEIHGQELRGVALALRQADDVGRARDS